MIVILPRNVEVDTNNVPEDFEQQIQDAFTAYTEGTADDYTFQDKLCFIDLCIERFHNPQRFNDDDIVMEFIKGRFENDLDNGDFPQESDYYNIDFMTECFCYGKEFRKMYSHDFGGEYCNRHEEEKIEKIIIRIIKAVLDWKGR